MDLSSDEARSLTDRIKAGVAELLPLVKEAFERRADRALGYESWGAYCDAELRGLRIPIQERREAVAELRAAGMDQRAIGSALGVDHKTVSNDLRSVGEDSPTDRLTAMSGGRTYERSRPVQPDVSAGIRDAVEEHQAEQTKRQADRQALDDLADELGLKPDPQAEADEDARIALLYPFYDAIATLAALPPAEDVIALIKPYERYRLDAVNAVDAWVDDFARAWRKTT